LANCVLPLPEYLETGLKFTRMLHNGYLARNPLSPEWAKQIRSGFPNLDWDRGPYKYTPLIRSTSAGFSVIGVSGAGKTTLIESLLSLYPQVIVHREYNGYPFDQQQLVYLKLDCPFDGSPRGLCTNFLFALDQVLGTNYIVKCDNPKYTTDRLLPAMAWIAGAVGLGVLVIDEIQRLKGAKKDGSSTLLNFFIQLTNTMKVPVVLVGTYKAFGLFTKEFALARRTTGQGDVVIHNFADDEVWDFFVNSIWKYQFTNIPTPLSPALKKVLYDESQGIADICVKIYMLAQWQVIGTNDEKITPALIKGIVRENLRNVEPTLRAIRNNDIETLCRIEDVRPQKNLLEEHLSQAIHRVSLQGTLNTLQNQESAAKAVQTGAGDSPVEQLAMLLVQAGYEAEVALKCAQKAYLRFASEVDLKLASSEAFRLAAEDFDPKKNTKESHAPHPSPRKEKVSSFSGDLREIIKKAAKGIPPYEALKAAGVIRPATEFL